MQAVYLPTTPTTNGNQNASDESDIDLNIYLYVGKCLSSLGRAANTVLSNTLYFIYQSQGLYLIFFQPGFVIIDVHYFD